MTLIVPVALVAALLSQGPFETFPDASGPVNCPDPPATIRTVEGRVYECHPEEGEPPYRDVTPPDEKTHWRLPFGSPRLPPNGTGSYHPPENWPFRSIVFGGHPGATGGEYFYIFDRSGVVIDSNYPGAIGDQMMEIRISGVRLWPTARVYYPIAPQNGKLKYRVSMPMDRNAATAFNVLVVDGDMLCPKLDESLFSYWPGESVSAWPQGTYINGHCGEADRFQMNAPAVVGGDDRLYTYPGFRAGGLELVWSFQRHDEPMRPMLNRRGGCIAQCPLVPATKVELLPSYSLTEDGSEIIVREHGEDHRCHLAHPATKARLSFDEKTVLLSDTTYALAEELASCGAKAVQARRISGKFGVLGDVNITHGVYVALSPAQSGNYTATVNKLRTNGTFVIPAGATSDSQPTPPKAPLSFRYSLGAEPFPVISLDGRYVAPDGIISCDPKAVVGVWDIIHRKRVVISDEAHGRDNACEALFGKKLE